MTQDTLLELCQTCGSAVRVVGHTTLSYQPIERMTEEELVMCDICFLHARYPPPPYRDKPDIRRLTSSLRSAYAEIDVLHSELGAMARQLAEVTNDYEFTSRELDMTNGTYELNRRRKNCICLGYRDPQQKFARDPQCRAHGEEAA